MQNGMLGTNFPDEPKLLETKVLQLELFEEKVQEILGPDGRRGA